MWIYVSNVDMKDSVHRSFIEITIELAKNAEKQGDAPCGGVLVENKEVVMREQNRMNTEKDIAAHPEFVIAREVAKRYSSSRRQDLVLYTTIEPCPMCATAIAYAGIGTVVYAISADEFAELIDTNPKVSAAEIFDRLNADVELIGGINTDQATSAVCQDLGWLASDTWHQP